MAEYFFDQREKLPGGPGLHALIVGVSRYPSAGEVAPQPGALANPKSPAAALAAVAFCDWLVEQGRGGHLPAPLATVRLLLSPSDGEFDARTDEAAEGAQGRATLLNFLVAADGWRRDASTHPGDVALFYFAGRDMPRGEHDKLLLLEDFNDGVGGMLRNAVSFYSLRGGMTRSPGRASTQLYFADALRVAPPGMKDVSRMYPSDVFDVEVDPGKPFDYAASTFYAFSLDAASYAPEPDGFPAFSRALLNSLRGGARESVADGGPDKLKWRVSVPSLDKALRAHVEELKKLRQSTLTYETLGTAHASTVCILDSPPAPDPVVFRAPAAQLAQPGLHALIIGVSNYPHLINGSGVPARHQMGMKTLTSPALSAYNLCRWLKENKDSLTTPLASVRLLISPSEEELEVCPEMKGKGDRATTHNLLAAARQWREDAGANRKKGNLTLFYFAGHGALRNNKTQVLLMEDYGNGVGTILDNAFDFDNLVQGMGPSTDNPYAASNQVYFVDACRTKPDQFQFYSELQARRVFDDKIIEGNTRESHNQLVLYAARPGEEAFATGKQQTFYSAALLKCLEGRAARYSDSDEGWYVTVRSIKETLDLYVREFSKGRQEIGITEKINSTEASEAASVYRLREPPQVEVELSIDPAKALDYTLVEVTDAEGNPLPEPLKNPLYPHPHTFCVRGGYYYINAQINYTGAASGGAPKKKSLMVLLEPPRKPQPVNVGPMLSALGVKL